MENTNAPLDEDESFDEYSSEDEGRARHASAHSILNENSRYKPLHNGAYMTHADNSAEVEQYSNEEWTDAEIYWSIDECERLVDFAVVQYPNEPRDWNAIAEGMGKSIANCKNWFSFLSQVDDLQRIYEERFKQSENDKAIPSESKKRPREDTNSNSRSDGINDDEEPDAKRQRKTAREISREWECGVLGCGRAYGTLKSLRQHNGLKHPDVLFNENTARARRDYKILGGPPGLMPQFTIPMSSLHTNYLVAPANPIVANTRSDNFNTLADNPYHSISHLFNIASNIDHSRAIQNQVSLAMLNNTAQRFALANTGLGALAAASDTLLHDNSAGLQSEAIRALTTPNITYPVWNPLGSQLTGTNRGIELYNLNIPRTSIQEGATKGPLPLPHEENGLHSPIPYESNAPEDVESHALH